MPASNIAAAIWFLMGGAWGYAAYRLIVHRYGHLARGRFAANWALMTCYFGGLGAAFVLWNGGRGGGEFSRGTFVAPYQWRWPEAIVFAVAGGFIVGGLLTWLRQPTSYSFDRRHDRPRP